MALGVRVAHKRRVELHRKNVVSAKSGSEHESMAEAIHQHASCDEKNHRHRYLRDHKRITSHEPAMRALSRLGILERGYQIGFRSLQRWGEAKDDRTGNCACKAEDQHSPVELGRDHDWQVRWNADRLQETYTAIREGESDDGSENCQ